MVTGRCLVVVASADSETTDSLAEVVRDRCTVRTAYTTDEALDCLDAQVDAVLLDPDLAATALPVVARAVDERDIGSRIGLLADEARAEELPEADAARVDTVVSPARGDDYVRDRVDWLVARARYEQLLDQYYELSRVYIDVDDESGVDEAELDRLREQMARLRRRLDTVADHLDTRSLFEAALDDGDEE